MKILEVIESRRWKNTKTGATASFYGAVPYTTLADESNWEVETVGYTWRNSNGTIGLGRAPAKTYEEAVAVMEHANSISDSFADEMARAAAVDHDTAETVERLREIQGEIRELIDEALTQVKLIDPDTAECAEAYWYRHILGAMHTIEKTARELESAKYPDDDEVPNYNYR